MGGWQCKKYKSKDSGDNGHASRYLFHRNWLLESRVYGCILFVILVCTLFALPSLLILSIVLIAFYTCVIYTVQNLDMHGIWWPLSQSLNFDMIIGHPYPLQYHCIKITVVRPSVRPCQIKILFNGHLMGQSRVGRQVKKLINYDVISCDISLKIKSA